MLSLLKSKKKKKSIAPFILENLTTIMTLSDRLRQAGIRECEPDYDPKNPQNRIYNNERKKKLQNISTDFYSSYFKDSHQNGACHGKVLSKNYKGFSRNLRKRIRGSAKKTLSASLHFINDCHKYKKKVRTPKSHSFLKSQQKNAIVSIDFKQPLDIKEEPQKLQGSKTDCYRSNLDIGNVDSAVLKLSEEEKLENSSFNKYSSFLGENKNMYENEATIGAEIKTQSKIELAETFSYVEPFIDKLPSGDVARIDRKYLELLLSITNKQKSKDRNSIKEDDIKNVKETTDERKKKKKTENIFPENNITIKETKNTGAEMQKDSRSNSLILYEDLEPARVFRDSTKSEVQILIQTEKNFRNQRSPEMKSEKNVTHNKPDDDIRKKRKNGNKLLKNKTEEFFNPVSPNEVSKIADVKELWRREAREKSDNSLSSNSSCTVPENDQSSDLKNLGLESYKFLQKIVAEEVKKISKQPENKNNIGQIKKEEIDCNTNMSKDIKSLKASGKRENICKTLNISLPEVSNKVKTERFVPKKKLTQAENQPRYSNYEGEKQNVQLLSLLVEDNLKDQKAQLKLIREKEDKTGKNASQTVQNWSILNRLEQAFVALGTPDFKNKNAKDAKAFKNENSPSNEKIYAGNVDIGNIQEEHIQKVSKTIPKSKEVVEKKDNGDFINTSGTNTKAGTQNPQDKKLECDRKRNLLKENQQGNNTKNDIKNNNSQIVTSTKKKVLEGKENKTMKENNTKLKKNKISTETTYGIFPKKANRRTLVHKKLSEYEFRHSKKKTQDLKTPPKGGSITPSKNHNNKKSSTILNKSSGAILEGKRTFDVIPNKDIFTTRKSESYIKTDDKLESESSKKQFLQNKTEEIKKNNFVEKNAKNELKLDGKIRENDTGSKNKSRPSRNSIRTPNKEKSRYSSEKEYLRTSQENSVKTSKGKTNQEKNCEKTEPMEELPQQILAKKELNFNERATKERSILSMRGNQQNTEESTKKMMQIEEKSTSDFHPTLKSSTGNLLIRKAQKDLNDLLEKSGTLAQSDFSRISNSSSSNYKLMDLSSSEKSDGVDIDSKENKWEFSKKLTPLFGYNNNIINPEQQKAGIEKELKFPRYQPLWEQDIHHYRAIVKDIMSQYKRLNGFLKQSDQWEYFSNDSINIVPAKDPISEDSTNFSDIFMKTDLQEYRKKIISEYQALPIFEYKSKLQQKKEENAKEAKKRNLLVVKDIKAEMDLDVKDFQPNIQKVLDSQLYVDTENLVKRNHPNVKFKEKNSSLQEIVLGKNEKMVTQEECPRSISTPKTFLLLPSSFVYSKSNQKVKTIESFQDDLTTAIMSVSCLEETESEII